MFKTVLALFMIFTLNFSLSAAIKRTQENVFSARKMGQVMAQCFGQNEIINCLENKIFETLDKAIANNETWQLSDYLFIEKNTPTSQSNTTEFIDKLPYQINKRSLSDTLALKILQLAQARSLKIQLPASVNRMLKEQRISSALDDFNGDGHEEELEQEEGRRKKDKDKNIAVVGGMAMLAMGAQMFLGKVILIAGAAFIMAKIALVISVLGSLKKSSVGSSSSTDHVIVTSGGGSHSHEYSGWNRRMPFNYNKFELAAADEHKFTEPSNYYNGAENDEFKSKTQDQQPPKQNNNLNKIHF